MFIVTTLFGCGQVPAAVKFTGDDKLVVYTVDSMKVQAATVDDKDGKAMETQPELKWSVSDADVAKLEGDQLTPLKSGTTTVKACVMDKVCGQYTVQVALPDKLVVSGVEGVEWKVGAVV